MSRKAAFISLALCLAFAGLTLAVLGQSPIRIRIGTAAPEGSIWHESLQQMKQDWERIAGNRVKVTIFPGGTQGDEATMLDRVRIRQLQGVALSGAVLSQADNGVSALLVPMMISSDEELDFILERLIPTLDRRLEEKGFIVLNWGDVGWVRFFSKEKALSLEDIRKMKLFTSAGDPETERLYRDFRFNPVPMAVTDLLPNLVTGVIDAFSVPPLFALANQSFSRAPHMLDLKWAPLVGATLIRKDTWEQIPQDLRPQLMQAARKAADQRREEIRALDESSIAVMQEKGLEVAPIDRALSRRLHAEAEDAWSKIRGKMAPAELFDQVVDLRGKFRRERIETLLARARETGQSPELRKIYSTILDELDPDNEEAAKGLIATLMEIAAVTRDRAELHKIYSEVLALDPDHKKAREGLKAVE